MIACLCGVAVLFLGLGYLIGTQALYLLYSIDLTNYKVALEISILGGCFCTFSYVFDNALIVVRKQYLLFFSYLIACIFMQISVNYFVSTYGILGAVLSYMASMLLFLITTICIFIGCVRKANK